MNRKIINQRIKTREKIIEQYQKEIDHLEKQRLLLIDRISQYKEEVETFIISKRPKLSGTALVGRVHWQQYFKDEAKPKSRGVKLERSRVVKVNGNWKSYIENSDLTPIKKP